MVDTASIIIASISMVGAVIAALFTGYITYAAEEHKRRREIKAEVRKYSGPLLLTTNDLQNRLWELIETPITKFDREEHNGKENLECFTCYLLAQFLAWKNILKVNTQFLAFYEDESSSDLRVILSKIEDELSTSRYDRSGWNFRLWPGHQLAIAENMVVLEKEKETGQLRPMGWHQFKGDFKEKFSFYFRYFQTSITEMLNAREKHTNGVPDQRLRRLQHFLVDLMDTLDPDKKLFQSNPLAKRKCRPASRCDCRGPECKGRGEELAKERSNRSRSCFAREAPTIGRGEKPHSPAGNRGDSRRHSEV
jgi:hypothetical protein